jgi:hypothetical protein
LKKLMSICALMGYIAPTATADFYLCQNLCGFFQHQHPGMRPDTHKLCRGKMPCCAAANDNKVY